MTSPLIEEGTLRHIEAEINSGQHPVFNTEAVEPLVKEIRRLWALEALHDALVAAQEDPFAEEPVPVVAAVKKKNKKKGE